MVSEPTRQATPTIDPSDGRRRILDAAAARFLRQGYAETSQRDIADAVGMKAGSLYYHFPSKDSMLEEILRIGIEAVDRTFLEIAHDLDRRGVRPVDRLLPHVRGHLGALFDHGDYTAAHVTVFPTAPEAVRAASIPVRDAYERRWHHLLTEIADQLATPTTVDVGLLRRFLLGAMRDTVAWFDPNGRRSLDDVAASLDHLVRSTLASPDPRSILT